MDRSTVTLRSLLNWVPINKPPPRIRDISLSPPPPAAVTEPQNEPKRPSEITNKEGDEVDEVDEVSDEIIDPFAPQLRLDADGNIILDELSLQIERPVEGTNISGIHVSEEAGLYSTTYNSYRRRPIQNRGRKWSEKDTTRFYRALSTIGTDFYSMTKLFPDRSRNQLLVMSFKIFSLSLPRHNLMYFLFYINYIMCHYLKMLVVEKLANLTRYDECFIPFLSPESTIMTDSRIFSNVFSLYSFSICNQNFRFRTVYTS